MLHVMTSVSNIENIDVLIHDSALFEGICLHIPPGSLTDYIVWEMQAMKLLGIFIKIKP